MAIRFYFATGARMQQVLQARWSDIIENTWYPFIPEERDCWFEASENLDAQALSILSRVADYHASEGITSIYLFPSIASNGTAPIKTIQRMWARTSGTMSWHNLPLSHLVWRHRPRTSPSYNLAFSRQFFGSVKRTKGQPDVSKVVNRRKINVYFSDSYL